jgi:hypothetical protein
MAVQRSSVQRRRVDARFQDERGSDRALLLLPESMEGPTLLCMWV